MMLFQSIPLSALLVLALWFVRRRVGVLAWGALIINLFAFGLAPEHICSNSAMLLKKSFCRVLLS